jgi:hypothetical protein
VAVVIEIVHRLAGLGIEASEYVWTSLMLLGYFAITTVGSTAGYVELRRVREGGGERLTGVFD